MQKNKWIWDGWQQQVLDWEGQDNTTGITLRCGRQVGKSEVVAAKIDKLCQKYPGIKILIISASERQSKLIFNKSLGYLKLRKVKFLERPTLEKILLQNGSEIWQLPAGRTGHFIRGPTFDILVADEAAYIPEAVWNAVIPMLAVSRSTRGFGWQILLSTPFGKGRYFYDTFTDDDFLAIHVSSEDCPRITKTFLLKEKRRLSKDVYKQEYLAEFVDEWNQFFPTNLIKKCMDFITWNLREDRMANSRLYLGVDFAAYGGAENAFVISELYKKINIKIVKVIITKRVSSSDTIGRIQKLNEIYRFSRIFVDDMGIGSSITDILTDKLGRKVVGLNNASKRFQNQGEEKKQGILKEDLYSNALTLMESGKIKMINHLGLLKSLKSIQYEYTSSSHYRKVKIFGNYSHITEAMVRACWCVKDRGLRLYIY